MDREKVPTSVNQSVIEFVYNNRARVGVGGKQIGRRDTIGVALCQGSYVRRGVGSVGLIV
jgi:hypothetical protein